MLWSMLTQSLQTRLQMSSPISQGMKTTSETYPSLVPVAIRNFSCVVLRIFEFGSAYNTSRHLQKPIKFRRRPGRHTNET